MIVRLLRDLNRGFGELHVPSKPRSHSSGCRPGSTPVPFITRLSMLGTHVRPRCAPNVGLSPSRAGAVGLATSPGVVCPFALRYGACATPLPSHHLRRPHLFPLPCRLSLNRTSRPGSPRATPRRPRRSFASTRPFWRSPTWTGCRDRRRRTRWPECR